MSRPLAYYIKCLRLLKGRMQVLPYSKDYGTVRAMKDECRHFSAITVGVACLSVVLIFSVLMIPAMHLRSMHAVVAGMALWSHMLLGTKVICAGKRFRVGNFDLGKYEEVQSRIHMRTYVCWSRSATPS